MDIEFDPELIRLRERVSFHEIAENLQKVLVITQPETGRVIYVSPAYERIWGQSRESLYLNPSSWMDQVMLDDLPRVQAAVAKQQSFSEDYRIHRPTGDLRYLRTRSYPTKEDGSVVRIISITEDLTEMRRLEQQLAQSQKMDAIGRLAGGIAHDFNNLLTVINGYAALLADRPDLPANTKADLNSIRKAGQRAASLTAQLLGFSRKQTVQMRDLDLNKAVEELEPMLRRLIRENVELNTVLARDQICIVADPTQIEQVLLNLVINARDAIDREGCISIETERVDFDMATAQLHGISKPGPYALLAVTDNGRGMSSETQERIFEPFFTTKQAGEGTGLGLATVYGIVKQCNGAIWVYSEEGIGSAFKVYLPLLSETAHEKPVQEERKSERGSGAVFMVEDDEQVREMTSMFLESRGYQVTQAANGEEAMALASIHAGPIDLLITDVIMPKMGGPELVARLSAQHPETNIIYISGYTENAVIRAGLTKPGLHHVAKPFTPDALARKVTEVLRTRAMSA